MLLTNLKDPGSNPTACLGTQNCYETPNFWVKKNKKKKTVINKIGLVGLRLYSLPKFGREAAK